MTIRGARVSMAPMIAAAASVGASVRNLPNASRPPRPPPPRAWPLGVARRPAAAGVCGRWVAWRRRPGGPPSRRARCRHIRAAGLPRSRGPRTCWCSRRPAPGRDQPEQARQVDDLRRRPGAQHRQEGRGTSARPHAGDVHQPLEVFEMRLVESAAQRHAALLIRISTWPKRSAAQSGSARIASASRGRRPGSPPLSRARGCARDRREPFGIAIDPAAGCIPSRRARWPARPRCRSRPRLRARLFPRAETSAPSFASRLAGWSGSWSRDSPASGIV